MIMYKDWEAQTASSITWQVLGFTLLVLGIYLLTATRDANPGLREGWRSVIGRDNLKPDYHLCDVEEKDPL